VLESWGRVHNAQDKLQAALNCEQMEKTKTSKFFNDLEWSNDWRTVTQGHLSNMSNIAF
jgi:hypothetical protein